MSTGAVDGSAGGGQASGGQASGQQTSGGQAVGGPVSQVRSTAIGFEIDAPLFVISVAAQLAGMHAQTLRSYDREGLVSPGRTTGGGRRYSQRDIELLREVQKLSQDEGVNRAGIRRIIELESQVDALRSRITELTAEIRALHADLVESRADAANAAANALASLRRDLVPWQSTATTMVTWQPPRRSR